MRGLLCALALALAHGAQDDGEAAPAAGQPLMGHWNGTILVGTHHKTGTLLLAKVFRVACRIIGVPRHKGNLTACAASFRARQPAVCIDEHVSAKSVRSWLTASSVFVHAVRDPLEMCVSAYQYHTLGTEPWLTQPLRDLGGLTLQQHYQKLGRSEGVRFECKRMVSELVENAVLYNATKQHPRVLTLRHEEVSKGYDEQMGRMFDFLRSGPLRKRLVTSAQQFDINRNAAGDARHVSASDEKAPLRAMLRSDPPLAALLEPLRALLGYSQAPPSTPAQLCDLLKSVCATTDVDFFAWCKRGHIPKGKLLSLPLCGDAPPKKPPPKKTPLNATKRGGAAPRDAPHHANATSRGGAAHPLGGAASGADAPFRRQRSEPGAASGASVPVHRQRPGSVRSPLSLLASAIALLLMLAAARNRHRFVAIAHGPLP